jgi:hypothetical protein
VDGKRVKCLTCEQTVLEIKSAQAKIDPKKKAEVKSGRFKSDGSLSGELIPLRTSEQYLTELFEGDDGICAKMDDYAKAKRKTDGKLVVMKMFVDNAMVINF